MGRMINMTQHAIKMSAMEIFHIPIRDNWSTSSHDGRTRLFQRVGHEDADEKVADLFMVFLSCAHQLKVLKDLKASGQNV